MARRSARAPAWSTWNSAKRTACCSSGSPLELDVGARPEVVEVARAARPAARPSRSPGRPPGRRRPGRAAPGRVRSQRPAVGHQLDEPEALPRLEDVGDHERGPSRPTSPSRSVAAVVPSTTWSMAAARPQAAPPGPVDEDRNLAVEHVLLGPQRRLEHRGDARVPARWRAAPRWRPARTARRRWPARRPAPPRRGWPTMARWVNETSRVEVTRTVRRPASSTPPARQRPGAQVEHAIVREQVAVADVEGLVVDEQPHQLAVGDVDHRLARLGGAVLRLGVGQRGAARRSRSGTCRAGRAAPPRRGCRAARCARSRARRATRSGPARRGRAWSRAAPRARPGTSGCSIMPCSSSSARSVDHHVGAVPRQEVRPARRGRRRPRSRTRRPGRPRRRRGRPRRRRPRPARPPARAPRPGTCPGRACRAGAPSRPATPSTRASKRSAMPAAASTSPQFLLEETTAVRRPRCRTARR